MLVHLISVFLFWAQPSLTEKAIPVYDYAEFEKAVLSKNNDTIYVINFWATWCKPCVKELPAFDSLANELKGEKMKVLLVSLDYAEKLETAVKPLLEKRGIQCDVVLLDDPDANAWINRIDSSWSGAIPATLFKYGQRHRFHEGDYTYAELKNAFNLFKSDTHEKH